jgi:hypothetical protein
MSSENELVSPTPVEDILGQFWSILQRVLKDGFTLGNKTLIEILGDCRERDFAFRRPVLYPLSYGRECDKSALLTVWAHSLKSVYTRLYTRCPEILRQPPYQNQFQNGGHQEELNNDSTFAPFRLC